MRKRTSSQAGVSAEPEFRLRCATYLRARWAAISARYQAVAPAVPDDPLGPGDELIPVIRDCLTSSIKTYHYVLPTQLLAKCVNPGLDSHCLQVAYGGPGAFDARSLAHDVIVPFDQDNHNVLGGSGEPYVSKPLRIPAIIPAYRSSQKKPAEWDKVALVLDAVENRNDDTFTKAVFDQILHEIYNLLAGTSVRYPIPHRISLETTYTLIDRFLSEKSGGDRLEAVATALFQTIGDRFGLFTEVRRQKVNAADQASGMAADVECYLDGRIVLLVEVKDRGLALVQLNIKLDSARSRRIEEILFIAQQGKADHDRADIDARVASEFVSGQNIYVTNFNDFALGVFILFGELGRVEFLAAVGAELDRSRSAIQHRQTWADLLRNT